MRFPGMEIYFSREYSMHRTSRLITPFCISITMTMSPVLYAISNPYDRGLVTMQGAIIGSACTIAAGSREQTIDMGIVPVGNIIREGQGNAHPFSIMLTNCVLEQPSSNSLGWKQFQVTFDGDVDGALFGIWGEANGVALQITDNMGNIAMPGNPLPLGDIMPKYMLLQYSIKLVANNQPLKAGRYFSSVRFRLDYY